MKAAIVGLEGPELTPDEVAVLHAMPPAGVILFSRNILGALPLARLVGDLRELLPPECVLLVDQEGGRVARLGPPDWAAHPSAGQIGALYEQDEEAGLRLAWLTGALIGLDCAEAGFDVVCAPVLDLAVPGATHAIGDRAFGGTPDQVIALCHAVADGLLSAGVQPVGKHVPGHGKALVDSHHGLPRIGASAELGPDISVFAACSALPWMMTAHILYDALDAVRPATMSPIIIEGVIRGAVGFDGVLVSDDLAMGALAGPPGDRVRGAMAAGCDLAMYCSGDIGATSAVLTAAPELSGAAQARMARGRSLADRCRLQLDRSALQADRAGCRPLVAAAGPAANFVLAWLAALCLHGLDALPDHAADIMESLLTTFILANLVLGLFNLLPIPPLDGGRIAVGVLPLRMAQAWARMERGGIVVVLLVVFLLPRLLAEFGIQFDPVGALLRGVLPWAFELVYRLAGLDG